MEEITLLVILFGIPAGIGVALDKLLLHKTKTKIHVWLLEKWYQLDQLKTDDIGRALAENIVFRGGRLNARFSVFSKWLIAFIFSSSLTYVALEVGRMFGGHDVIGNASAEQKLIIIAMFILNFICDAATLFITYKILKAFIRYSLIKALPFMVLDIAIAFSLSMSCIALVTFLAGEDGFIESYVEAYSLWIGLLLEKDVEYLSGFLYSSTTFIPTVLLLSLLYSMAVAKFIISVSKRGYMYFIERVTEVESDKDLAVFTLTGSVFSILAVTIKGILKAANIIFSS